MSDFTAQAFWQELCALCAAQGCRMEDGFPRYEQIALCDSIDSTNSELLRQMEQAGELRDAAGQLTAAGKRFHLALLAAARQTKGRGRLNRMFYSPAQAGIYFSFVLVPPEGIVRPALYTVSSVVGVCRAIEALYDIPTTIKWVNDIYMAGKKVCGILTEGTTNPRKGMVEAVVVGIGINMSGSGDLPQELASHVGSIAEAGGSASVSRICLLARVVFEIMRIFASGEHIMEEYRKRSFLQGKTVRVSPLVEGGRPYDAQVCAVTDDAGLLVRLPDGTKKVLHSGEVSLHSDSGASA